MLRDGVDDSVAERFALLVPGALGQLVRRVLDEARHHVFARRRYAWIRQAGDDDIDVGLAREIAVLRVVIGALHVLDAWRNGDRAAEMSTETGEALKIREPVERKVYLAGGAPEFVAT